MFVFSPHRINVQNISWKFLAILVKLKINNFAKKCKDVLRNYYISEIVIQNKIILKLNYVALSWKQCYVWPFSQMISSLTGTKHKTILEARSGLGPIKAYPRLGPKPSPDQGGELSSDPNTQERTFHCEICNVRVNSELQLKQVKTLKTKSSWWEMAS